MESLDRERKTRRIGQQNEGGIRSGRGWRRASKSAGDMEGVDGEHISHPALSAVFGAWERAAVDFCADQEASSSGSGQVCRVCGEKCMWREGRAWTSRAISTSCSGSGAADFFSLASR